MYFQCVLHLKCMYCRSKDMYIESLSGFANGIRTADGGAHIDGLKFAISKVVNTLAKKVTTPLTHTCIHTI